LSIRTFARASSVAATLAAPLSLLAPLMGALHAPAHAQDAEAFYKGKTVTIVIGAAPGGGYDTYGRLVARAG